MNPRPSTLRPVQKMIARPTLTSGLLMALAIAATPALLAAAVSGLLPGSAFAQHAVIQPTSVQSADRSLSRTVLDFEGRGYLVRSVEDDGRTHDVEAVTPDGRRIEALVDATTGEVLSERADD